MRTGVLATLLLSAAAGAAWYFYGVAPAPPPATPVVTDTPTVMVAPPPFRITGTLISPETKVVHLVILDAERQPQGDAISAQEGETVAAYLVKRIDNHRVYFERDGQLFLMHVGGDRVVQDDTPAPTNPAKQKERTGQFIPPPANIEAIRKDTAIYIEQLKEQPDFKRALEERRRQHLEQQAGAAP